jgi:hypothetical protein
MFQIAGDHFNGREAGTLDELKVSMWLANKAKEAGMKPAGDDGTFFSFQFIPTPSKLTQRLRLGIKGMNCGSKS